LTVNFNKPNLIFVVQIHNMKSSVSFLLDKTIDGEFLNGEELLHLYHQAPLGVLMNAAHRLRQTLNNPKIVTWMIDRNINISNRCFCGCKFCNFHEKPGSPKIYETTKEEYRKKIDELFRFGGNQILLQGGLDPKWDIGFYETLFRFLKQEFPQLKVHALGPAEIFFIAKKSRLSIEKTLQRLIDAGLDSLPGAGAEILVDRVRKLVSPNKCTADQWIEVMRIAHRMGMLTSATMMFGHLETIEERIEHLLRIREVQAQKPESSPGFKAFIPWPFQKNGTVLEQEYSQIKKVIPSEYLRLLSISRLALVNIQNIQASWLTVGREVGQVALYAGANDLGSIMIEENVVSSTGTRFTMTKEQMIQTIVEAGFEPLQRNQDYTIYDQ